MEENEKAIIILIIIFSCFLLVMGVFFFLLFTKYHRNLKLRQKEAINNLIKGQDSERERLARDLHDEMGPELSSIIFLIDEIKPPDSNISEIKLLAKSKLREAVNSIRQISHDLMPVTLTKYGLLESIVELKEKYQSILNIEFITNCDNFKFTENVESHLYKIIKELIYNTQKHGDANSVEIRLMRDNTKNQIVLEYRDNGKGFVKPEGIVTGTGIKNINTRVDLMNGIMQLDGTNGFKMNIIINNIF
jgi:two-component system NarL family sensor kinase